MSNDISCYRNFDLFNNIIICLDNITCIQQYNLYSINIRIDNTINFNQLIINEN